MRFKDVKMIIDKWDPMNLWRCGCPVDEYDNESQEIWKAALSNSGTEHLAKFIYDLLNEYFCDYCQSLNACKVIAEEVSMLEGERTVLQFHCPLLKQEISEEYCSRINMEALYRGNLLTANGESIDKTEVAKTCRDCTHLFWTDEIINEYIRNEIIVKSKFDRFL